MTLNQLDPKLDARKWNKCSIVTTISPNSSVTTYVKANISNVFELSVDESILEIY